MIIGGITFAGELLHAWLPLPVPASVYGMILLFLCLCLKIIKEDQIRETADFLLLIMPVLFVGPGVGIIDNYMAVSDAILPLSLIHISRKQNLCPIFQVQMSFSSVRCV